MNTRIALGIVGTTVLAAVFLSVLLRDEPTLATPLLDTEIVEEPRRKDVLVKDGVILEGVLREDLTGDRPYIIRGELRIPPGTTVTVHPGARLFVERDGRVLVEGTLIAHGSQWASNERHPTRRLWYGIIGSGGGTVDVKGSVIHDATAAVTCGTGSTVTVAESRLTRNVVGIATLPGSSCAVTDTRIDRGRVGIQIVGGTPTVTRVTLDRLTDALRIFHDASPRVAKLTLSQISQYAVLYRASSPLTIDGLSWRSSRDLAEAILDGTDEPTHLWDGQEVPTGRVTVVR